MIFSVFLILTVGLLSIIDQFLPLPSSQESSSVCHRKCDFNHRSLHPSLLPLWHNLFKKKRKKNQMLHHFWDISRDIRTTWKLVGTILHIVLSYAGTFRQIAALEPPKNENCGHERNNLGCCLIFPRGSF